MKPSFPTAPDAQITQVFGNYAPDLYPGDGTHQGIDYGVPVGTPVYACMDGNVILIAQNQQGYGRNLRIVHNDGYISIYAHLSSMLVQIGDSVISGQQIGLSGGDPSDNIDGDGTSTGAHLHWEIRPANKTYSDQDAIDPEEYCLKFLPAAQKAEVTAFPVLNVRSKPTIQGEVTRTLPFEQMVEVTEISNGWARLRSLRPEWCSADYLAMDGIAALTDAEKLSRLWELHPELHGY